MSQFNFNMMDAAGYGFYRVWVERSYLLKLLIIPLMIKFACMVTVMVLGLEDNILRQGLILFPGALAEGWVLSQFLRTLLKNERWPTVIPPDIDDQLLDKLLLRARGIVAGTLAFSLFALMTYLIRYVLFGLIFGNFQSGGEDDMAALMRATDPDSAPELKIAGTTMFSLIALGIGLFWAFRLMWVYIPFSVLMPLKDYLKAVNGMLSSVKMMVLYFCTMTPVMFVTILISRVVFSLTEGMGDSGDDIAHFIMLFIAVIADTFVALVSTAAFVWAMREFLPKDTDLLKDLPQIGGKS